MKNIMENMKHLSRGSTFANQFLFFLRFIQQGSLVLSGFIAIHFVYWHDRIRNPIPRELIVYIVMASLVFLENYIISAISLARQNTKPNYFLLLKTSLPSTIAISAGYYFLRQVPFIRAWCEGDNDFVENYTYGAFDKFGTAAKDMTGAVEAHMCALTCVIIAAGAVALSFTIFISVFAVVAMLIEKRGWSIKLEDADDEYSDELLPGLEESEKI